MDAKSQIEPEAAAPAPAPLLEALGVRKAYATPQGPLPVLKSVDLTLSFGATIALMGESGSGKSTLLHLLAGLDDADGGEIRLDGVPLSGLADPARAKLRRETLAVVFQQLNLIQSLNVADNLAFHARLAGRCDRSWLDGLAARLRLEPLMHRYPEQLSGGQQQRIAIGRALAARPRLLLADEPTGNLDEASADEIMRLALDLVAETGCAFLMVTHSARLAALLQRRLVLHGGVLAPP